MLSVASLRGPGFAAAVYVDAAGERFQTFPLRYAAVNVRQSPAVRGVDGHALARHVCRGLESHGVPADPPEKAAKLDLLDPPNEHGTAVVTPELEALQAELKALMASWEYAFAMGHGCSVGDHPQHRAVRDRVADLRAPIAEHTP